MGYGRLGRKARSPVKGESFNEFTNRVINTFRYILHNSPANTLIITHSSVIKVLKAWEKAGMKTDNSIDKQFYHDQETTLGRLYEFKGKNGPIWVARHGETEDNVAGNLRSKDTTLTQKGEEQIQKIVDELNEKGILPPYIMTSDLHRAIQTATGIVNQLSLKREETKPTAEPAKPKEKIPHIGDFTNHSGGAEGADTQWEKIGELYGIKTKPYSFKGHKQTSKTPVVLTTEQLKEADEHLKKANEVLKRRFPASNQYINNLLRRNWYQVKNSDAVYAISTIDSKKKTVNGGTGWAVQMGIDNSKKVYVFDQNQKQWFQWNGKDFERTSVPLLTSNFAGIGTREINEAGKDRKSTRLNSSHHSISYAVF